MANIPKVKFPQSPFIDANGNVTREWIQWLLNPQFLSFTLQGVIGVDSGGTGIGSTPANGQLLIGNGIGYSLAALTPALDRTTVFNGPGSITIDISAAYAGQSSIVTVGTLTGGIWQATTISPTYGGTGLNSYAVGDLIVAAGTNTLTRLADIATGNALITGGVGVAPLWGKIGLSTHVSGTLSESSGGTGQTTYTIGDLLYASGTTTLAKLADVVAGNALLSGGVSGVPLWGKVGLGTHVSGNLPIANLNSGTGASASTYWRGNGVWGNPLGLSGTPTIAAGTGAGTGPTIAIAGTDHGFKITLTTGTLPTLGAVICTVTFSGTYATAPHTVFCPGNGNTALLSGASMVFGTDTTTTFVLTGGTTALTAATQYIWECVNLV